jgi:hypothetical protein
VAANKQRNWKSSAPENDHKLEMRIGNKIISNPTAITEKLNMYFISTVE